MIGQITVAELQPDPVPKISEWGLIVLTLLLLAAGTLVIGRQGRQRPATA